MRLLDRFSRASLCSMNYVVIKTLTEKKTTQYPNQKGLITQCA